MTRTPDPVFREWVERARAVPIGDVAERRGLKLTGHAGTRERVGPCPACGGRDRFGVNTHKGVFVCRWCTPDGGDVISLVQLVDGCDFLRACETLTGEPAPCGEGHGLSVAELAEREAARAAADAARAAASDEFRQRERRRLHRWWKRLPRDPIGTPVEAYLALRRLRLPPHGLRYDPAAGLWSSGKRDATLVHTGPAMVAGITGPDDKFAGLHTTWIDLSDPAGKVRVPDPVDGEFVPAKKARGSAGAGRIELVRVADPWHVVIGEGIETVLSMREDLLDAGRDLAGVAFWSAYSLGNLGGPSEDRLDHPTFKDKRGRPLRVQGRTPAGEGIPIPDSVERITLLRDGDSDAFLTGVTLDRASLRWARPGRIIVAAEAPAGTDFNDLRRGAP